MNRKIWLVFGVALLATVVFSIVAFRHFMLKQQPAGSDVKITPAGVTRTGHATTGLASTPVDVASPGKAAADRATPAADPATMTEEEREAFAERVTERLQEALDDDDPLRILPEAKKLMAHPEPFVRMKVVEALDWIDEKGVVLLTDLLHDPDPEVAAAASEAWFEQIRDVEDDTTKSELLGLAVLPVDGLTEDFLVEALDQLSSIAEYPAAQLLNEMLKNCMREDFQEHILDTINFVTQPDEMPEDKAQALKILEEWLSNPENQKTDDEDDE